MSDPDFIVGMETSGTVRDAILARGRSAISVDLLPAQNGGPHHQGDVFAYLEGRSRPVAAVFHPECTFHTLSAAWAFMDPDFIRYPGVGYHQRVKPGTLTGAARRAARLAAEADVERIKALPFVKVIENPRGTLPKRTSLGAPHQVVNPFQFGADASKATCLWWFDAEGRPMLGTSLAIDPAKYIAPRMWCPACSRCSPYEAAAKGCECGGEAGSMLPRWANQTDSGQNRESPSDTRWQVRSDTYPGIAEALADVLVRL